MTPEEEIADIRYSLELIAEPGSVFEIRGVGERIGSGYFDTDHISDAANIIHKIDSAGKYSGIYVTLNPPNPDLLSRRANRFEWNLRDGKTTADADIIRRRWLLIDTDAQRASGISASQEEHDAAIDMANQISSFLSEIFGFPAPVKADSGNGGHLLYRIDLPNDKASTDLIQSLLNGLNGAFTDEKIKVDTTVYNPARISKLYGTVARKGDDTPNRPHRKSRILEMPDEIEIVSPEKLHAVVSALAPPPPTPAPQTTQKTGSGDDGFTLDKWLSQWGTALPTYHAKPKESFWRSFYVFDVCPWDPSHTNRSAFMGQMISGPIIARCHHDGCAGNQFRELRAVAGDTGHRISAERRTNTEDIKPESGGFGEITESELNERMRLHQQSQTLKLETRLPQDHFITQCVKYGSALSDAYLDYHVANALMLLSTATYRKPFISLSSGPLYCNLWIFGLGRSTSSRKTTAMKWATRVLKEMEMLGPSSYSPEALIEKLSEKPYMVLAKDEAGSLLASMQKPYMSDVRDLFCDLYECGGIDRHLRTKPRSGDKTQFVIDETFVNCYYMTTFESFLKYVSGLDVTSGWLYRFLYVGPNYYREKRPFELSRGIEEEARIFITTWIMRLFNLFRGDLSTQIDIEPEAWRYYQNWQMRLEDEIDRHDNETESALFGRVSTTALKIAVLFTIGDARYEIGTPVSLDYMKEACRVCEEYFLPMGIDVVNQINDHGQQNLQERCIKELRKRNGCVDHRFLLQLTRSNKDDFRKAISTLEETGEVEARIIKKPGRKDKVIYILNLNGDEDCSIDREDSNNSYVSKVSESSSGEATVRSTTDTSITNFTNNATNDKLSGSQGERIA